MSVTMEFNIAVEISARNREAARNIAEYLAKDINDRDFTNLVRAAVTSEYVVDES